MTDAATSDTITVVQPTARLGDPHICSDAKDRLSVLAALYEPLVRRSPGAGYAPALAAGWSVDPGARSWTFALREGVRFHSGHELEAADVVASLERVRDPALGGELGTQGVYRSYIGDASFEALGRDRVRITTPEPLADLLDILSELPVAPRRALAGLPRAAVGTGPFRLSAAGDGRVELEAFDGYWGGAPAAARLVFRAEPDAAARAAAVLAGEADIAAELDRPARAAVLADGRAELHSRRGGLCVILMCNALAGPCADARVRQALNYAVDAAALVEALHPDAADPNSGAVTPLHFGFDPETPPYPHDLGRARELLAEAGHARGLTLTLDAPTIWPDEALALAELLRAQLAPAGVELVVRAHADRPAYAEMVRAKQIGDLCVFDSSPLSTFRVLREKLHSATRGPWWQGYASAETDALIEQAQATADTAQREATYRLAYRRIRDDAPWVFLYSPRLFWGAGPGARGWQPSADGVVRLA